MSSEDKQTQGISIFQVVLQAMVGVGGAIFFVLILLNYAWQSPDGVNTWQIGISIIFIIVSGFLSMVWGDKFLDALVKLLNSSDGL
jgi:hypothetical protein